MLSDQSARSINFLPAVISLWQNTTGDGVAASSSLLSRKKSPADETRYEPIKRKEKSMFGVTCGLGWALGRGSGLGLIALIECFRKKCIDMRSSVFSACLALPAYRRLSSSAGRSNVMSLSYFSWLASCTKRTFITWFMNLKGGHGGTSQIHLHKGQASINTVVSGCAHLSMVPNSHCGSLFRGMSMLWKWANLVAISAEMTGSESCSVRRWLLWGEGNSDDFLRYICFKREPGLHTTLEDEAWNRQPNGPLVNEKKKIF